ncbi:MAG TPA: 50S ribosomal protein L11 methyltransferase [Pyrinomonadaceae bacterium]|nr:50S ribosomal protein L11 methyltransferase [Pyrinomonadaceae bacterium]
MYTVIAYGEMIADTVRCDAYARALRQSIKPGSVVVEIGCGATAFFSILACQFGARKVYAIEPDSSIGLAKEIVQANGLSDRIELIQEFSTRVDLPEKADVIVSDLRGILPLFQRHIPSIADARTRLLAPNGKLIAERDTLYAAIIESPEEYKRFCEPWDNGTCEVDLRAGKRLVTNTWTKTKNSTGEQLLTERQSWAELDYTTIENLDPQGEVTLKVVRNGTAHGLCVWFDSTLSEGVGFSNAPDSPKLIYGQAFFPLSEPIVLNTGDVVRISIHADFVSDDYVWRWHTIVSEAGSKTIKANFEQSSFFSAPLSLPQLRKRSAEYVPTLNDEGVLDSFVLQQMRGKQSSGEIATQLLQRFPEEFTDEVDALTRIGELAQKYSR